MWSNEKKIVSDPAVPLIKAKLDFLINNRFLRKRGLASTLKMEYQVFLCIFQKNSAMATLGLKEFSRFLQT